MAKVQDEIRTADPGPARTRIGLSIVIPLFNEEGNVRPLHQAIAQALVGYDGDYEVIAVDDGSTDRTLALLEAIHEEDPRWTVIALRRNFGQTAALSAGFDHARGDVVVTLDGDLQNDPEDIPGLLELSARYDIVSGWRADRQDPFLTRRLPSALANRLISAITGVRLHDYGCTLKAYRREVIQDLRLYGEMHRYIPAIASWMGTSVAEMKVRHHPRRSGVSKYGLRRTFKVLLDLITVKFLLSFATRPIQVFGLVGLVLGGLGTAVGGYLAYIKFALGESIAQRPLLLLSVLLIVLGGQFVGMGLVCELLVRLYHESVGKPIYRISRILRRPG
ncbi:MAG: glycosyltransferase family 2 protein [Armatimonadota bacterium]|nr:glycosyltransferase family 2 protein [Armatimonadota bacterium]MDR7549349.1 glycosyltransferase family 2 protein [Armatimonadota bacterium]